jgi:HPt (histidine-containing phosphotransfer) domain-containing protein
MQILHKTRGGLGSLGVKRVAAIARNIEQAMKEEQRQEVERQWPVLIQEMKTALNAAQTWLMQQHTKESPASTHPSAPAEAIASLCAALAEHNMSACDHYLSLRPALLSLLPEAGLHELDQAMNGLQFERALSIITPLSLATGPNDIASV